MSPLQRARGVSSQRTKDPHKVKGKRAPTAFATLRGRLTPPIEEEAAAEKATGAAIGEELGRSDTAGVRGHLSETEEVIPRFFAAKANVSYLVPVFPNFDSEMF